mmetsp:Transcript_46842/g.111464  ORF Transcript_46842/g.111464 Transcript_46842/m.111464 type:complete len:194 (-) Transcript_46842:131-712(-)
MSFAALLSKKVVEKKQAQVDREKVIPKWIAHESRLLDQAVDLFKQRCIREAEQQKCELSVSFEALTRDIPEFPKRIVSNSTWIVDSWGDGNAESWFYATRGTQQEWVAGEPVPFAELLAGILPKFVERLKPLGFKTCEREEGTWKVRVSWREPSDNEVPEPKKPQPAVSFEDSPDRSPTLSASPSPVNNKRKR